MTAAQLVHDNVPYLVELVRQGGERLRDEEEPQGEPASTFLHYHSVGGIVVPASALSLDSRATTGTVRIRFADDTGWIAQLFKPNVDLGWVGQALLDEVRDRRGQVLAAADQPLRHSFTGHKWSGRWFRLPRRPRSPRDVDILREVAETDRSFNRHHFEDGYEIIGVVFKEEVQQGTWEDVWVFLVAHEGPPMRVALLRGMRYSPGDLRQRIPELASVAAAKISVMGLGTLGGEVAWQLAKAQCGTLRLADHDHVEAATGVRWSNGLTAAGGLKPYFLKMAIEADHPYVNVEPYSLMVGAAYVERETLSEAEYLERWMNDSQVIVDATAEQNVRRVLAYLAHPRRIPQVYVWSIDGYGGVVASILPGKTGCLLCLEKALSPDGGYIRSPSASDDPERLRVQPRGCADRTFTGALVDLAPLAGETARMALSLICSGVDGGYPPLPYPVETAQFRESDGTLCVPTWTGYDLAPSPDNCDLCARTA